MADQVNAVGNEVGATGKWNVTGTLSLYAALDTLQSSDGRLA
jgi:hypothetical protein